MIVSNDALDRLIEEEEINLANGTKHQSSLPKIVNNVPKK